MSTFTDKKIVDELIANNGLIGERAPDNIPAVRIVEYETPEGDTVWGIVWEGESNPYRYDDDTAYIVRPRLIWTPMYPTWYCGPCGNRNHGFEDRCWNCNSPRLD